MDGKCFFFAGGGTGGHIYPAVAVAKKILELEPNARVHFFCSSRPVDSHILGHNDLEFTVLPAKGLSFRPGRFVDFCTSFVKSGKIVRRLIGDSKGCMVIGVGGFVAAPACRTAYKSKVPVVLMNVDIVPGRANKLIARWADEIFVQFEETKQYFAGSKAAISVVGCPLRSGFEDTHPSRAIEQLELEVDKKILLITGASSGSANINDAICSLLKKLDAFAGEWQIVHLTGHENFEKVKSRYAEARISHKVVGYYDDMPNLLAAADLVVGRSGAVSVAEYAAASAPSICMPYPYHKDRHQYLNAGKLVEAGAAVIVDDLPDEKNRAQLLWEVLQELMKDETGRELMLKGCREVARPNAAFLIAEKLVKGNFGIHA